MPDVPKASPPEAEVTSAAISRNSSQVQVESSDRVETDAEARGHPRGDARLGHALAEARGVDEVGEIDEGAAGGVLRQKRLIHLHDVGGGPARDLRRQAVPVARPLARLGFEPHVG
jgi:hypothetical protein